jgi:hypothetical protein
MGAVVPRDRVSAATRRSSEHCRIVRAAKGCMMCRSWKALRNPARGMEMRKATGILFCAIAVLLLTAASSPRSTQTSYADDRAEIENLQARYIFALDFRDADTYASTFTEDGVLDYGPVVRVATRSEQ